MIRRRACESLAAFRMATEHRNFGSLNYVSGGCLSCAYTEQLEHNLRESAVFCLEARTYSSHLRRRGLSVKLVKKLL
jgi:hypothetical protein